MIDKQKSVPESSLEEVKAKFKKWRRTRKNLRPIPKKLWAAAVSLSPAYSISQISRALCLNHTALSRRIKPKGKGPVTEAETAAPAFIELDFGGSSSMSECIIEMENASGAKMRMHFKGTVEIDLLELGKAFWRKES